MYGYQFEIHKKMNLKAVVAREQRTEKAPV